MTAKFTDKDLGWTMVLGGAKAAATIPDIQVGFFDEHNATKAAANEYGSRSTPERPFMRTALDANANKYFALYHDILDVFLTATPTSGPPGRDAAGRFLSPGRTGAAVIGVEARNDIIESIQSGAWTPNAPSTIKAKGSSKPLVDTGELQRALTFKLTKRRPTGDEGGE